MLRLVLVVLSCCAVSSTAFGDILIDDDFDNGDSESGGINGGFVEVGNDQDADILVTEEGSLVTIDMISIQANPNKGIVSIEPFDATSVPGFQATFVVSEITDNRCCNGHFLGISDDNMTFFRAIKNFGLAFFGNEARTESSEGFGFVVNDIDSPGAETIIATDLIDLDSYLDGFTASFSAGPDGWSYSVSDVIDFDGNSDPLEDSGSWEDAGLEASFYDDFFDEEEYVFVSAQINSGEHFQTYDRITVETLGGNGNGAPQLQAGDADQNLEFNQLDLVQVQIAAKYLTEQAATWGDGDWDGAPGGSQGNPPAGDGRFSQLDIIAALGSGNYLEGPYAAVKVGGQPGDGQTSVGYDPATGEVFVDSPEGAQLTSINIDSASGIFVGDPAQNLGGSFDNDADGNIFKATFGSNFEALSFGNVAQAGLSEEVVANDLTVVGSLAGGGPLGEVDLIYVPEPSTIVLLALGMLFCLGFRRD